MGLRSILAATGIAGLVALIATDALAQRARTRFDGIRDCERHAAIRFKHHNQAFRRFVIDRANVSVERYADRVGNQFVSTIYQGRATYDAGNGPRRVRYICLHAGAGRSAVFVHVLPE